MEHDLEVQLGRVATETEAFFHREKYLTDAKQADDRNQEVEAVEHLLDPKCEAQLSGDLVETDRAKAESEHHRSHRLERRFLAQPYETAKSEEIDRENLGG